MPDESQKKYISLKEAAQISGYAPDYIGQLIRSGKIKGKMVYSNVAWVTTEEAIREYMAKEERAGKKKGPRSKRLTAAASNLYEKGLESPAFPRFYRFFLWTTLAAAVILFLLVFYIFAVNVEKKLEERIKNAAETEIKP